MAGAGARQRMAGEVTQQPGFWQSLGDNGYTRGWSEMAARVLSPLDRMMASDVELREALAKSFGTAPAGVDIAAHRGGLLDALDPSGGLKGRYESKGEAAIEKSMAKAQAGGMPLTPEQAAELLLRDKLAAKVDREALLAGMQQYGPGLPVSTPGQWAHAALGNPAAAYALPLGGAGLAAWGLHDVMAAQQQAERESQLPLA